MAHFNPNSEYLGRMARFSACDRHNMFYDVNRWEPLAWFSRPFDCHDRFAMENIRNFKVQTLFDYSLLRNGNNGKKIVQLNGVAPIIEDEDDPNFKGDTCQLEYRRRSAGTAVEANSSMEVPIALTRYLHPHLRFDVMTTKTFLSMLCRFVDNEHRFYRFNIERVGNLIIIEEICFGDARLAKSYLQGALDILTGRSTLDYRQVSVCEFGARTVLLRQHVDLAEPCGRNSMHSYCQKKLFFPLAKESVSAFAQLQGFMDHPEPIFHIDGSNVAIQGSLVPDPPKIPIEIICRSFQRFSSCGIQNRLKVLVAFAYFFKKSRELWLLFKNLEMKWQDMIFSGAERIVSVLHVRGLIDHRPKSFTFDEIAPKGYKCTLSRASLLCRHIFDFIQSVNHPERDKLALIWVSDKQSSSDLNDGDHLVIYRRRPSGRSFDDNAFVSHSLRSILYRDVIEFVD
ncbi:unnamed protein product [Thelazia callipaeda]|uniref:Uncharacterized protein n=1 Tax=Thelazia callipaeda TaxID=103827 RepID=A0A0N5CLL3_THECL|nr:unnamed protein product [Thelazia callipaeda]